MRDDFYTLTLKVRVAVPHSRYSVDCDDLLDELASELTNAVDAVPRVISSEVLDTEFDGADAWADEE